LIAEPLEELVTRIAGIAFLLSISVGNSRGVTLVIVGIVDAVRVVVSRQSPV
jgi:hypothetical protein